jgi:hypothetical protein
MGDRFPSPFTLYPFKSPPCFARRYPFCGRHQFSSELLIAPEKDLLRTYAGNLHIHTSGHGHFLVPRRYFKKAVRLATYLYALIFHTPAFIRSRCFDWKVDIRRPPIERPIVTFHQAAIRYMPTNLISREIEIQCQTLYLQIQG